MTTVITQPGLFDPEPFRVEVTRPRVKIPPTGVEWRRNALKRDCDGCWEQQKDEWETNNFTRVRAHASWILRIWDDRGEVSHQGYYCDDHAKILGCDTSRLVSKERRQAKAEADRKALNTLTASINDLIATASRGKITAQWCDEMRGLIGRAGGAGLDMPHWHIDAGGHLQGVFTRHVATEVRSWAEAFGTDVDKEDLIGQTRYQAVCKVVEWPTVKVTVSGYIDRT